MPARYLADLPAGEDAERIVAHLLLSLLSCHLRLPEAAASHIAGAIEILDASPRGGQTIRNTRKTRVVRVLTTANGLSASLLLPMIGDEVIAPTLAPDTVRQLVMLEKSPFGEITFSDIAIDHVRLRLRRTSLSASLTTLLENISIERLAASLEALTNRCILPAHQAAEALDAADDFLTLARGFTRQGNHALAQPCLQKARSHIALYGRATTDMTHRQQSENMARKITRLAGQLGTALS